MRSTVNKNTTTTTSDQQHHHPKLSRSVPQADVERGSGGGGSHSMEGGDDDMSSAAGPTTKQTTAPETWHTIVIQHKTLVARSRWVVSLVLITATVLVSGSIYRLLRRDQSEDFVRAFEAHADKVIGSFHRSVERKLQAVDALSVAITSHAVAANQTFPRVTLPDFEVRTSGIRVLSESPLVNMCVLVTDADRGKWEQYLRTERADYLNRSVTRDAQWREHQDRLFDLASPGRMPIPDIPFQDRITNLKMPEGTFEVAPENSGPYLSIWQVSPAVPWPTSYNFNLFSHPGVGFSFREAVLTGSAVMAIADNYQDASYGSNTDYFKLVYSHSQYRHQTGDDYQGGPTTGLAYPIFDSLDPDAERKTVGIISTMIPWRLNFANILPPDARGVYCVLSNTFNQTMTFRIDGGDAVYVGPGDRHDPKYNHLESSAAVHEYLQRIASPDTAAFTSVALNSDHSRYYLKVYPSIDTERVYRNREPIMVMVVVIGVFAFTSLVFFTYDFLVGNQFNFVMNRALTSSAIVSSLFPAQVRETLYEEKQQEAGKTETEILRSKAIARFVKMTGGSDDGPSKPIVARFAATTIFFADIAGFTKWSSQRTPEIVFVLLETLYQAFDEIAVRRSAFKVETIGDCYMAAAGLPEPQDDHAVIMAKFANDCLQKSREIVRELSDKLGEDTSDLELRIGLHSGPVTGGVLRGQKGRFQLFGDTVNTASRMESTGKAGSIQISQSTADELKRHNKAHWLKPRDDKVVAKGKGELSTFWLTVVHGAAASVLSSQPDLLEL